MNIHSFERQVNQKIVARGLAYYENGNIVDVEYRDNNTYSFLIEGTENYEVIVRLNEDGTVLYSTCECPYDMGNTCKHEVAAYYELQDILDETSEDKGGQPRKQSDLKTTLSHLSKEKLVDIIMDISRKDSMMRSTLLFKYAPKDSTQTFDKCKVLIDETIRRHAGWEGFITYRNMSGFVSEMDSVLEVVPEEEDKLVALDIAGLLLEKAIEVMQYSDDSNGDLGYLMDQTLEAIKEIAMETYDFDQQEAFVSKIFSLSEKEVFDEWEEYRIELLSVCCEFAANDVLRSRLTNKLEGLLVKQANDRYSNYRNESILKILFDILENYGTHDKVQRFIEINLKYTFFRELLIEQSMKEKNYQKVLELALEGEKQDKEYRGLVSNWKKSRYDAYKGLSMETEQRSLGRKLLFDGDMNYYKELKELSRGREKELYEEMKLELRKDKWRESVFLSLIEEENDIDEMLEYVRENPREIERYAPELMENHREEVIQLFEMKIKSVAQTSSNRRDYQGVCMILDRFKELAGQAYQQKLISELVLLYKRKPAFVDELSKIR